MFGDFEFPYIFLLQEFVMHPLVGFRGDGVVEQMMVLC
jgi:hypothetical protein